MSKSSGYTKSSPRISPLPRSYGSKSSFNSRYVGSPRSSSTNTSIKPNPNSYMHSSPRSNQYPTTRYEYPRKDILSRVDPDPRPISLEEYDIEKLLEKLAKKSKK